MSGSRSLWSPCTHGRGLSSLGYMMPNIDNFLSSFRFQAGVEPCRVLGKERTRTVSCILGQLGSLQRCSTLLRRPSATCPPINSSSTRWTYESLLECDFLSRISGVCHVTTAFLPFTSAQRPPKRSLALHLPCHPSKAEVDALRSTSRLLAKAVLGHASQHSLHVGTLQC